MIRLWGRISSINVRKVVVTLRLLDQPYERIDAGSEFGIVGTPGYRARNPNALVPLLDHDGYELWESNAIVRYLCATFADGVLYPRDLHARFDAERWMDWQQTTLNKAGREAFLQLVRTPPGQRRQDVVDASIAATEPLWDLLDAHLQRRAFLAGEALTMADIPIACEVHRWRGLPLDWRPRPNLDTWWSRMLALPATQGVLDQPLA